MEHLERPELRGAHSTKKAIKNKAAVQKWMLNNPTKTMKKCQDDLSLSHVTVRKYMKQLGDEAIKRYLDEEVCK